MATKVGAVWALDIGNNSVKALHLTNERGIVEVVGFDYIQHGKIVTGTGVTPVEKDELIALSLRGFVEQHDLADDEVVVSMPSQNSFARFVNLPPVEPKRIPEIVKFEAAQQIPFDINDVQWDWQLMTEAEGPDTKVGIFAIKNDVVDSVLEHLSRENVKVSYVQMAPMALYNYVFYDRAELEGPENPAIIALDVGAENTDLVVCTKSTVWQRCIPMGGNAFTRAIADAFKLNFERAEKLKRTAPMSKYARQIFQAMRPIFTDLASEVQRSLNFYSNSNPNTKLVKVIAFGGGTKMRGLLKYLRQSLQLPVERPDSFKKLPMAPGVSAAKFHENVPDFGIVYGLAVQALGMARIESNLLPRSVARSMTWASKARYFNIAAAMLLVVSFMCLARAGWDRVNYDRNTQYRQKTHSAIQVAQQAGRMLSEQESKGADLDRRIKKAFEPLGCRDIVPLLHQTIIAQLPNERNNPEQEGLYKAFAHSDVPRVLKTPRKERKQMFITNMSAGFVDDVAVAPLREVGLVSGGSRKPAQKGEDTEDWEDERYYEEMQRGAFAAPKYQAPTYQVGGPQAGDAAEQGGPGFVVTIEGYSPYENIVELLDPMGVKGVQSKWGVVTRLMNLDEIVDGNSTFELFGKTNTQHFRLETGEVDLESDMPAGIGVVDVISEKAEGDKTARTDAEVVLIDPMTKEIVSKVPKRGEDGKPAYDRLGQVDYEINDHWFVLKLKFIWKDAPKEASPAAAPAGTPGAAWGR
ncbi:MAG: type IV pilus assembly protein PilM [Planctomycetota bacterium]|jgi:type IV pilus assembly protein PilM